MPQEDEPVISLLIAEDDALLRHFLLQRLAGEENLTVVGTVENGREAVEAVAQLKPRVLLLDLGLPDLSGLKVLEQLAASEHLPEVLVLTGEETPEVQLEAVRHGARGFLCKSKAGPELLDAVRAVASGEVWLSRQLVSRIVGDYPALIRRRQEQERPIHQLTEREREVLVRIGQGMTNQQIATALYVSVSAVKLHLRSVFEKLELSNRAEAAVFAAREGLLQEDEKKSIARCGSR